MKTCYQTDPGKVRSHNEDSVTIVKNLKGEYLLVVADGMGGHKAGEIASSLVVTELGKRFSELSSIGTKEEAVIWLKEIIDEINVKPLNISSQSSFKFACSLSSMEMKITPRSERSFLAMRRRFDINDSHFEWR